LRRVPGAGSSCWLLAKNPNASSYLPASAAVRPASKSSSASDRSALAGETNNANPSGIVSLSQFNEITPDRPTASPRIPRRLAQRTRSHVLLEPYTVTLHGRPARMLSALAHLPQPLVRRRTSRGGKQPARASEPRTKNRGSFRGWLRSLPQHPIRSRGPGAAAVWILRTRRVFARVWSTAGGSSWGTRKPNRRCSD